MGSRSTRKTDIDSYEPVQQVAARRAREGVSVQWQAEQPRSRMAVSSLIILAAFLGAAWGGTEYLDLGLPEHWPADEIGWISAGMINSHTFNPNYFMYPSLMINVSYLFSQLALVFTGHGDAQQIEYVVGVVSRSVSLAFFLGLIYLGGALPRRLFQGRSGAFGAAFVATIGVLMHHAHIATVNSAFFFGTGLALFLIARFLVVKTEGAFYAAVAAAALTVGAKYNGLFLFSAFPLIWLYVFGNPLRLQLLKNVVVSLLISAGVFFLCTPYSVIVPERFLQDFDNLVNVEGPKFKTGFTVMGYIEQYPQFYRAFFGPLTLYLMLAVIGVWTVLLLSGIRSRILRPYEPEQTSVIWKVVSTYLLIFLVFNLMNFSVGIFQSRYFIPGAIVFAFSFLVCAYDLWIVGRLARPRLALACGAALIPAMLFVSIVNSFAQVRVFPLSPKASVRRVVDKILSAEPERSITAVTYPGRGPFQKLPTDERIYYFQTMVAAYDVETWDEYLKIIEDSIKQNNSDYVVYECIIEVWNIFLPKKYNGVYTRRHDYPNPGSAAWEQMLSRAGYSIEKRVVAEPLPAWVPAIIGDSYLSTIEGTGGAGCAVNFFRRADAAPL